MKRGVSELIHLRQESNAGAVFRQQTKSRGAAQTNLYDDKDLVEGGPAKRIERLPAGRQEVMKRVTKGSSSYNG